MLYTESFSISSSPKYYPSGGSLAVTGGTSAVVQFGSMSGSGWSFAVQLYNVNTGNYTPVHIVTSSNPSTTFTDLIDGNFRIYVVNTQSGTSWSGTIYMLYTYIV